MAPRVLLLTQWFDPEPTFKGMIFARELRRLGFDVEVVTGFPNYPGGRVYEGYRLKWIQRECIDGVQITRLLLYPSHDESGVRRALNYVSFSLTALAYCLLVAKRPRVIYAYLPPLTVGIAATIVRMVRRVPVVCDIQDMWPDTLKATGMFSNAVALRLVSRMCDWVYCHVDRIVVLSPGFKGLLAQRGVPDSRIDVIYNWCDEAALNAAVGTVPQGLPMEGKFRIVFAGNMGKAQALDAVLQAALLLQAQTPEIHFVLIGGGVETERLKRMSAELGLVNVSFVSRVSIDEVGAMLRQADALLVHLGTDKLFDITIPSKTQAYMAIGKPILMAVNGDASALVSSSGCGVLASPGDAASIASAATSLFRCDKQSLRKMGERGRTYYEEHLSLKVGAAKFAHILDRLSEGAGHIG